MEDTDHKIYDCFPLCVLCNTDYHIINANLRLENVESENLEAIFNNLTSVRNMCAKRSDVPYDVTSNITVREFFLYISGREWRRSVPRVNQMQKFSKTLSLVWQKHGQHILEECYNIEKPLNRNTPIMLMIMLNTVHTQPREASVHADILRAAGCVTMSAWEQRIYIQFIGGNAIQYAFFANDGINTVKCYAQLGTKEKLNFFRTLNAYIVYTFNSSQAGFVDTFLLQHLSKDFKMKSICIMHSSLNEIDKMMFLELREHLKFLILLSGRGHYRQVYFATDYSLFLNVSSLLRCVVAASRNSEKDIYKSTNKFEEMLFELKIILLHCIVNLVYNNPTNKGYCLDTQLMPVLLECTNSCISIIKTLSIEFIQKACFGCPEIQQVIANLIQQGLASSDILTELNLDLGSLRINPNRD